MKLLPLTMVAIVLSGCSSPGSSNFATTTSTGDSSSSSRVIPTTTKSPEALAHFQKGEALFYNLRTTEAAEELRQALQLDPGFVQAQAIHGATVLGAAGAREIEQSAVAAAALPQTERLFVEALAAGTRGDAGRAESMLKQLQQL